MGIHENVAKSIKLCRALGPGVGFHQIMHLENQMQRFFVLAPLWPGLQAVVMPVIQVVAWHRCLLLVSVRTFIVFRLFSTFNIQAPCEALGKQEGINGHISRLTYKRTVR